MTIELCPIDGCTNAQFGYKVICADHFKAVPFQLRHTIESRYRNMQHAMGDTHAQMNRSLNEAIQAGVDAIHDKMRNGFIVEICRNKEPPREGVPASKLEQCGKEIVWMKTRLGKICPVGFEHLSPGDTLYNPKVHVRHHAECRFPRDPIAPDQKKKRRY